MGEPPTDGAVGAAVAGSLDGERVDRAVALLTGLTRAEVSGLVDAGAVRVDGKVVTTRSRRVRAGQRLDVTMPAPATGGGLVADPQVALAVVYEDDDVVVVDKPAGLVVHPGAGHHTGTMVHGLLARYPDLASVGAPERPGVVHRLDKGTSGLLVVARTEAAYRDLVAQLAARRVERRYTAVVLGTVDADEGVVDAPLGRGGRDPTRITVDAAGRPARTHYRVEGRSAKPVPVTLLDCRLETGRTHQIRVHLAAIGHPVLGDGRYGPPGAWRPLGPERPFLHARALAFDHPRTGVRVALSSPLPPDLEALLAPLGPICPI